MEAREEPVIEESEEQLKERKRRYNAEKSKRSYLKKKEQVLKNRILRRVGCGGSVNEETVANRDGRFTEDEMRMLQQSKANATNARFVAPITPEMQELGTADLREASRNKFAFIEEDTTSEAYLETKRNCENKQLTLQDASTIMNYIVERHPQRVLEVNPDPTERRMWGLMSKSRKNQRTLAFKGYYSKLKIILEICGTSNLLDVYTNIENFHNRILSSHVKPGSVKGYFSALRTLHKYSSDAVLPGTNNFVKFNAWIHPDQVKKLVAYINSGVALAKDQANARTIEEQYYDWGDFKKMVEIVKNHPERNTVRGMRDHIILHMYVYELVLRDDLGEIEIIENKLPKMKDEFDKRNYLNLKTGVLYLHHYKTAKAYGDFSTVLFDDTLQLVKTYLNALKTQRNGTLPKYLITKDNGELFKNGKLSGYITDMFKRYTTPPNRPIHSNPLNITINSMRHSFVTHIRQSRGGTRYASFLLGVMRHSFEQDNEYIRNTEPVSFLDDVDIPIPASLSVNPRCIVPMPIESGVQEHEMARVISKQRTNGDLCKYDVVLRNKTRRIFMTPQLGFLEL